MHRPILYDFEIFRSFDVLHGLRDILEGLGQLAQDSFYGSASPIAVATGLTPSQTTTASLTVNFANGAMYQLGTVDPNGYGSLTGAGEANIVIQGVYAAGSLTLVTTGLLSGQGQWVLVEGQVQFVDVIRTNDPNSGVLPYGNTANPLQPLNGPAGSGTAQNTERTAVLVIQLKYGVPATQGSEVPPTADSGWAPLFLIDLTFGTTQITTSQVHVAAPNITAADGASSGANYPYAPFLAGLLNQHHLGTPGQAPQIDLTKEVQLVLPLTNIPTTGTQLPSSTAPSLPRLFIYAGNPNNVITAKEGDLCYDSANSALWIAGSAGINQWVRPNFVKGEQTFSASGTFTPPAGVFSVRVKVWGAGGGGGGAAATSAGGGGGAGGYAQGVVSVTPGTGVTVTVGAGGTAGPAGGATQPTAGTASTFSSISGGGGSPGVSVTTGTGLGGNGGAGTGGDLLATGTPGNAGFVLSSIDFGGYGGHAFAGLSLPSNLSSGVGPAGPSPGGGGWGGANNASGGAGGGGLVVVQW